MCISEFTRETGNENSQTLFCVMKVDKFGTFLSIIIVKRNEDLTERVKMGDVHCFFFGLKR
jgi:phage head maturation protease